MRIFELILEDAPADPKRALVHFEKSIPDQWEDLLSEEDFFAFNKFFDAYIDKYEITLTGSDLPEHQLERIALQYSESKYEFVYRLSLIRGSKLILIGDDLISNAEAALDAIETKFIESGEVGSFGRANLTSEEKERIRESLDHIRGLIDRSPLPIRKKNALFSRINALQKEVDLEGTKTDRFFAFMGDLSLCFGQMAENGKPALDEGKEILRIVMKNRAKAEGSVLPGPEGQNLIPDFKGDEEE